jgi:hypothetical protein
MDEAELHYQRTNQLCDLARWQDAILEANRCLSIEPQHYRALCAISRCQYELGDYEKLCKTFYLFKALDWITLTVGLLGLYLNFKLILPYQFEKKRD